MGTFAIAEFIEKAPLVVFVLISVSDQGVLA
jgi:hypothetical protein